MSAAPSASIVAQVVLGAIPDRHGFFRSVQRSFDLRPLIGLLVLPVGTWLVVQ